MGESGRRRRRVGPTDDLSGDPFLRKVLDWARRQDGLGAVLLTGSRARARGPVDAASDYDVEVLSQSATPRRRCGSRRSPLCGCRSARPRAARETSADVSRTSRSSRGGTKVDLQIRPTEALADIAEEGLDDLYERGYVVLADPSGLASRLPAPSRRSPRLRPPTDAELLDVCSEFWFEAAHIPPTSRAANCGSSSSATGP